MRFIAAALVFLALAPWVSADEAKPDTKESEAVIAYGASHSECQEWTDGCVICSRGADALNCSTPGIACQPGPTVCKSTAK